MPTKLQAFSLDPPELAAEGREELILSAYTDGIEVADKGLDLGDQVVKQFLAEGVFGSRPIDRVWPLVPVKIPLRIQPSEALTFDEVRSRLAAKAAEINDAGAVLKRALPSGKVIYADVIEAHLHLSGSWLAENRDRDLEAMLELQRLPEWYEETVEGESHTFTGDGTFTQIVEGDLPARVESLTITDTSGNNQRGLLWHFRGKNRSSASTAAWAYNAEALELLDLAEKVTLEGSYGTKVVKHPSLSTEWTPVLGTDIGGSEFLTQVGVYDVWARVESAPTVPFTERPWLRLLWGVGDVVSPAENRQVQVPAHGNYYLVNLGQINITALPFGAQRWKGVIQARGEWGGENLSIDRLYFLCGDESSGILRASTESSALPSIKASDSLKGEGALSGSSATRGGKWEEIGASGEAFARSANGAVRSSKEESEARLALLSESTIGAVQVSLELKTSSEAKQGFYLRYFSSTYWVRITRPNLSAFWYVEWQAGGAVESHVLVDPTIVRSAFNAVSGTITDNAEVIVNIAGSIAAYVLPATFKKGEVHAEGKVGIYDQNPYVTEATRVYRNFIAAPLPPGDAVIYANRNARLSTAGMYRQSEDGGGYGPIAYPGADLPRLPVSGPNEAPVEIAVKPTRGDTESLADAGKDGFTAQIEYRPCWAEIPGS